MNTKSKLLSSLGAVSALAFTLAVHAADKVDVSKLPPVAAKTGVTFDKDIKPLIERSCAKCHGGEKPKGKYRVDTKENLMKGGAEHGEAVIKGKSADSPIVHFVSDLVEDMEMPPKDKRDKYKPLSKDEVGLLRAWIDQGAN